MTSQCTIHTGPVITINTGQQGCIIATAPALPRCLAVGNISLIINCHGVSQGKSRS